MLPHYLNLDEYKNSSLLLFDHVWYKQTAQQTLLMHLNKLRISNIINSHIIIYHYITVWAV